MVKYLLYGAKGVTADVIDKEAVKWNFRTTPSGGSLYPTELYFLSFNVNGIKSGMYFYNPLNNSAIKLEEYSPSNLRNKICEGVATLKTTIDGSSLCIILASFMLKINFKYVERAYRFVLLEAGHIRQNNR